MGTHAGIGIDAAGMVDLQRYPIGDIQTPHGAAFADKCHAEFSETGLCRLPGFIMPAALEVLAQEANKLSADAFYCKTTHNAYLTEADGELDKTDVRQRREQTYVGSVAYDLIPEDAALKRLYLWDP